MLNEKQTDASSWKNKLELPDSLPEAFITDKNAAWEKLYQRLHKKPRRKKAAWYWSAAACLLVALLIPWLMINKKENRLVKTGRLQNHEKIISVPAEAALQKEPVAVIASTIPETELLPKIIHPVAARRPANRNTLPGTPSAANTGTAIANTAAIINIVPPAGTPLTITAMAVVKKPLRVVHINEIETVPVADPEQIVSSAGHEQNNFRFKFGNSHSVNPPAAGRQEYAGILKIALTN